MTTTDPCPQCNTFRWPHRGLEQPYDRGRWCPCYQRADVEHLPPSCCAKRRRCGCTPQRLCPQHWQAATRAERAVVLGKQRREPLTNVDNT